MKTTAFVLLAAATVLAVGAAGCSLGDHKETREPAIMCYPEEISGSEVPLKIQLTEEVANDRYARIVVHPKGCNYWVQGTSPLPAYWRGPISTVAFAGTAQVELSQDYEIILCSVPKNSTGIKEGETRSLDKIPGLVIHHVVSLRRTDTSQ